MTTVQAVDAAATMWETSRVGGRLSNGAFVGRAAELDRLDAMLAALAERGASTVLLGGDAGIGKSRLIEEFRARAQARGALVALGVCTPAEGGGLPYGPVVGVLRDVARQLAASDVEELLGPAQRLLGLGGFARDDIGQAAVAAAPGDLGKTKLFEALLRSISALSERSPVVLVFEDLQWADSASVEVIDFLTRNLADRPVLVIATSRADEVERDRPLRRLLAELGRHTRVSELEISGLDRTEMAALLAAVLRRQPEWSLVDAVQARSGGNPFFAEELAAARHAESLPPSLRKLVMLRIDRLPPDARHVVAVAAAAGAVVHHRLLTETAGFDSQRLDAALVEAVDRQVLVADPAERAFRFRHALLREAVNAALLPGERSRLHHDLAAALTAHPELGAAGPAHAVVELADHWWEAGDWPDAFRASAAAADAAAALLAIPEAYAYFERALAARELVVQAGGDVDHVDHVDHIDHFELLMKAADAAYLVGEAQRSVDLLHAAMRLVPDAPDPRRVAACFTMLGRNAWAAGDSELSAHSLRQAAALLPRHASGELAAVLAEEARGLMLMAHYDAAEAKCREALTIARAANARLEEGHLLITHGVCVSERGDTDAGLALLREGLVIAETLADPDQLNRAYANLGHGLMQASRLEEAVELVYGGSEIGDDVVGVRLNGAGQNSVDALIRLGRWRDADDLISRMVERGNGSCVFGPYAVRATLAIRRGRFDDAARLLDMADALSAGLVTLQVRGSLHMLRAELHLERGESKAALEEIEQALTIAAGTEDAMYRQEICALGLRSVADDFDDARARGRRLDSEKVLRLAAGLLDEADEIIERHRAQGFGCLPRLLALSGLCHAEASRVGAPDAELWREAAARWDAAHEPYFATYCRWREADALLSSRSDRRRAAQCAQAAWRSAEQLGAATLQARIERLAERGRLGLTAAQPAEIPRARAVAEDLGLTARETEVLAQLAKGRTDRQIADELFISKKTASVHVSNLLRKLDAVNRVEAGEIGQRAGLT